MNPIKKLRGEHSLNVFISYELKNRLAQLARRYDRPTADMVRAILKIGIPMMEGISQAEETMIQEYVEIFRKLRRVKQLKE